MQIVRMSDMVAEMKTVWAEFIVELGYTSDQGEKFADGYAEALSKLTTLRKLEALESQDDECMRAGFRAAGIDETEALERNQAFLLVADALENENYHEC